MLFYTFKKTFFYNIMEVTNDFPANLKKINSNIESLKDKINYFKFIINDLNNEVIKIDNNFNNYIKSLEKKKKRKEKKGFSTPTLLSDSLASFMKLEQPYASRTDVTKFITKYIKDNNLQDPSNKTIILPDNQLKILFSTDDNFTYFNMQKILNKHFLEYNK